MSPTPHFQQKSDMVRLLLIRKYGGLWTDANSYFLIDFSWAENFDLPYIYNKVGESPQLLLSAYSAGEIFPK